MKTLLLKLLPIFLGALLTIYGILKAEYNWDLIGYVAASHYHSGMSSEKLHRITFSEIQHEVRPEKYQELTEGNEYRKTVANSSESLWQHLPFYQIRVAYISLIRFSSWLFNATTTQATVILSSVFAGIAFAMILMVFRSNSYWMTLTFAAVALALGFKEISSLATPDSMAAVFSLALLFSYHRHPRLATALAMTLPLVRTDFIILSGLVALCMFFRRQRIHAAVIIAGSILVYLAINKAFSNYGYLKIFNFTLLQIDPLPAHLNIEKNLMPYLDAYYRGFASFIGHKHFFVFSIYLLIWWKFIEPRQVREFNEQVFIILGFTLFHMLLFPAYYQRFFVWGATVAGIQLIVWVSELRKSKSFSPFKISQP